MQERARETKCQLLKYFWRIFVAVPVTPVSVFCPSPSHIQVQVQVFKFKLLVGKKKRGGVVFMSDFKNGFCMLLCIILQVQDGT